MYGYKPIRLEFMFRNWLYNIRQVHVPPVTKKKNEIRRNHISEKHSSNLYLLDLQNVSPCSLCLVFCASEAGHRWGPRAFCSGSEPGRSPIGVPNRQDRLVVFLLV